MGTITGLYIICLAVGFIFALVGAIFGEFGSHGDAAVGEHGAEFGSHDADMGGAEVGDHGVELGDHGVGAVGHAGDMSYADINGLHVSPLNAITMATFIGSFGAMGLIGLWGLHLAPLTSLAFAIPAAVLASAAQFVFYVKVFIGSSGSSEATTSDILNCTAEVITTIPESGVGEIAYAIKGFRYTSPARSVDGTEIPRGGRVRIVRAAAGVMQVREF